jgi:hypothetical protein
MPILARAFGFAAMAGGALRVVDSFLAQTLSAWTLAALYFATDVFLLLGMAGIYLDRRSTLGVAGVSGVATFVVGILLVRGAAFGMLGVNGYQLAAAIALIGLVILSTETLLRKNDATASAALWLSAFAFGMIGALGFMTPLMTILAGVAFGAGFIVAGWGEVARAQADPVSGG